MLQDEISKESLLKSEISQIVHNMEVACDVTVCILKDMIMVDQLDTCTMNLQLDFVPVREFVSWCIRPFYAEVSV